jgi:hypothetical protein
LRRQSGSEGSHNPKLLIPATTSLSFRRVNLLRGYVMSRSLVSQAHPSASVYCAGMIENQWWTSMVENDSGHQWWIPIPVRLMRRIKCCRASSFVVLLECMVVFRTASSNRPLYTITVGILPAATSPLFGRQGDALGVVVGKLTKKKYGLELTCSNTANQTRRMKGYRPGFSVCQFFAR